MRVQLGNPAPKEAHTGADGETRHRPLPGKRITSIVVPDSYTLLEQVSAVAAPDGVWNHHSEGDSVADTTPEWVEADDDNLAQLIGAALGCRVGRPRRWKESFGDTGDTTAGDDDQ